MRPDEHRKKKNEAYKRKHGIKNKSNDFTKTVKSSTVNENVNKAQPLTATKKNEASSSSEEEVSRKPRFERRKLVSNWERYEEPREEIGESKSLGTDFQQLITNTASALSQFRFKSEGVLGHDCTSDIQLDCDFLNINCNDLSVTMKCVPHHKLLDMEESYFEVQHLENLNKIAEMNMIEYTNSKNVFNLASNEESDVNLGKPTVSFMAKTNEQKVNSRDEIEILSEENDIQNETIENKTLILDSGTVLPVIEASAQTLSTDSLSHLPMCDTSSIVETLEDNLQDLLNLDNFSIKKDTNISPVLPTHSANKSPEKKETNYPQVIEENSNKGAESKKVTNLENWLDSFLDD